ncbi:hypothetical protein D3C86_1929170 [compost metagenome]
MQHPRTRFFLDPNFVKVFEGDEVCLPADKPDPFRGHFDSAADPNEHRCNHHGRNQRQAYQQRERPHAGFGISSCLEGDGDLQALPEQNCCKEEGARAQGQRGPRRGGVH